MNNYRYLIQDMTSCHDYLDNIKGEIEAKDDADSIEKTKKLVEQLAKDYPQRRFELREIERIIQKEVVKRIYHRKVLQP